MLVLLHMLEEAALLPWLAHSHTVFSDLHADDMPKPTQKDKLVKTAPSADSISTMQ